MTTPLIRPVRDQNNAEHDALRGPCACGANHQSENDYFQKLDIVGQAVVLETRRQTAVLPPITTPPRKDPRVVESVSTDGDEHLTGLVFKVRVYGSQPAVIIAHPDGYAPTDGPYLGDNNFTGLPDAMKPGIYEITADYDFHQGYFEGHRADGESSWEYTVKNIRKLEECLARVFLDSGALAVLCRKEKNHEDPVHEAILSGDVAEFTVLERTDVVVSWEGPGVA